MEYFSEICHLISPIRTCALKKLILERVFMFTERRKANKHHKTNYNKHIAFCAKKNTLRRLKGKSKTVKLKKAPKQASIQILTLWRHVMT